MAEDTDSLTNFVSLFALWSGAVVVMACVCSGIGRLLAKKHRQQLEARLRGLSCLELSTLGSVSGSGTVRSSDLVTGSAVFAADYLQQLIATVRFLIGGRIPAYEHLIRTARQEALVRLREIADKRGASIVVNVRFETSRVSLWTNPGCIEILAFGTAVVFNETTS
tara:strand:- start:118 stop:615 length:498 start_codon:yes stop_codon:yes gene_type:complete